MARKILKRFAHFDIKSIRQVNTAIDDIQRLAKINRKARKDIFFRNRVFNTKKHFGGQSLRSKIDAKYEKEAKKVKTAMGLNALVEVLRGDNPLRSFARQSLKIGPLSGKRGAWLDRKLFQDKYLEYKKREKIINRGFRKFSKTPPEKKSSNILKRGLSKSQIAEYNEGSGLPKDWTLQGNRMNFANPANNTGRTLRDLKKTRKQMALDTINKTKKSRKTLHEDINKRAKYKVRFIRRNGRVIPIKVKGNK